MMRSESSASASSKITDIVRLQQILKKWKKLATTRRRSATDHASPSTVAAAASGMNKLLKRTLSLSDSNALPRGYVAVCAGEELKRFVIPMEYLGHHLFARLLREAEEEFGYQQQGVLKFPCQLPEFHDTLKMIAQATPQSNSTTTPALLRCAHKLPQDATL